MCVYIYWYKLSQSIYIFTYILVQTQLQMHLRRILSFGILMFIYLELSFLWTCRLFSWLRRCIKKLTSCLILHTIFFLLVLRAPEGWPHFICDRTAQRFPCHPHPLILPCAVLARPPSLSSFSLSLLSDISACLSPSRRKSCKSPASRRLVLLLLITSVVPVMPLLSVLWEGPHPALWATRSFAALPWWALRPLSIGLVLLVACF